MTIDVDLHSRRSTLFGSRAGFSLLIEENINEVLSSSLEKRTLTAFSATSKVWSRANASSVHHCHSKTSWKQHSTVNLTMYSVHYGNI